MAIQQPPANSWFPAAARPALLAALVAAALFAVTLGGTYVYDDFDVFGLDPRLRQPQQWWRYWTESYNQGVDNLYRPLVSMSYAMQWWLHGADAQIDESDAWKYHLVNVLLHAAVSAGVAELTRRLSGSPAAYVAGLLFAVHPIHVEAVANIVGRAELMCALGVVGALVLFLRPLTAARACAITGCCAVALLSKEQGMLTPLLLLLLAPARRAKIASADRVGQPATPRRKQLTPQLLLIILLTWTLAGYIAFRETILPFGWDRSLLDWTINPLIRADADRWTMPLLLLGRYAALLIAPVRLAPDYGATVIGWTVHARDPYLWLGLAAIVAWGAWLAIAVVRGRREQQFCLLALAVTYGVVSNFPLLIGTIFGERLMYLPSVFVVILVASGADRLPRALWVMAVAILVVLLGARAFTYAQRWNDRLSFYQISLAENPGSVRLQLLLISEYQVRGQLDEAAVLAEQATEQLPNYWEVWIARADVAMHRGEFDEANEFMMTAANTPDAPIMRVVRWMTRLEELRSRQRD